jgi:hypothetical protein
VLFFLLVQTILQFFWQPAQRRHVTRQTVRE